MASDLTVIMKTKDLCSYIMTVTQKSPKYFRFSFVNRLHNLALDIIENLYMANSYFVSKDRPEELEKRLALQREAYTKLKLLGYVSYLAMEQGCILSKQYKVISKLIFDSENLLRAWKAGDQKRVGIKN